MSSESSSSFHIFLIGDISTKIISNKLPSKHDVLRVLFFNLRQAKLKLKESCILAVKEVLIFWEKAGLSTQNEYRCFGKLETLYQEWRNVCRNFGRPFNKTKEDNFKQELDDLFDIAHTNALDTKHVDEGRRNFLINQRKKGRPGYICDVKPVEEINREDKQRNEPISQNTNHSATGKLRLNLNSI